MQTSPLINTCLEDAPTPHFDGTPEEFPEREHAMKTYASLFRLLLEMRNKGETEMAMDIGIEMDSWQAKICRGPGQFWQNFIKTIPGFEDYWDDFRAAGLDAIEDMRNDS